MIASIRGRLERVAERFEEVTGLLADPQIQSDQDHYRALGREYAQLEPVVRCFRDYQAFAAEIRGAEEMLDDPEMAPLAREAVADARARQAALEPELERLLIPPDPNDERNVYLEIRAGTGGAEAALFAGDLLRMYLRYAELRGWRTEAVSASPGEHGDYKEVVTRIAGQDVYSQLKFKDGTHRVQRVPETEAQGRVHTSACTVAVMPEADELTEIDINPADLRIDTFRASGAGGQHINKSDSAVRMTRDPRLLAEALRFRAATAERIAELLMPRRGELRHPEPRLAIDLAVQFAFALMLHFAVVGEVRGGGRSLSDRELEAEIARNFLAYVGAPAEGETS